MTRILYTEYLSLTSVFLSYCSLFVDRTLVCLSISPYVSSSFFSTSFISKALYSAVQRFDGIDKCHAHFLLIEANCLTASCLATLLPTLAHRLLQAPSESGPRSVGSLGALAARVKERGDFNVGLHNVR